MLYEPARPDLLRSDVLARLEALADAGAWDELAMTFFRDALLVSVHELEALRATESGHPSSLMPPRRCGTSAR